MVDVQEDFGVTDLIRQFIGCGMKFKRIAEYLGINPRSLYRIRCSMSVEDTLSKNLSDEELREIILQIKNDNPQFGEVYVKAALLRNGFKVPRQRIRNVIHEIDPVGCVQRKKPKITRGNYSVPGSMFMWHNDGNETCQHFHIYVHGCVDGHSRKSIYIKCTNNKRASTPLKFFYDAAMSYGLPRFVRFDRGGENIRIGEFMEDNLQPQGTDRCVLVGSSHRNVRIERFWGEINKITLSFKLLFYDMERSGILNAYDPIHIFALHFIFLPRMQKALDNYTEIWDVHSLSTEQFRSPLDMFLTEPYGPGYPVLHHPVFELEPEEEVTAEQNEFASSIVPDPMLDDGNSGVNLYVQLVQSIYDSLV